MRTLSNVTTRGAGVGTDPLAGSLAVLLTAPLRELYVVLLRAGVIDVED